MVCRSHDVDATEVKERAAFWGALCKLLLLMPSPAPALSSEALPEDWQLRAFGPLNAAHQHLHFQLPRTEKVRSLCPDRARSSAMQLRSLGVRCSPSLPTLQLRSPVHSSQAYRHMQASKPVSPSAQPSSPPG